MESFKHFQDSLRVVLSGSVKFFTILHIFPSMKGKKSEGCALFFAFVLKGGRRVRDTLFYPFLMKGKKSEGYTVLPLHNEGEEE